MPFALNAPNHAGGALPLLVSAGYDKMIRFWDVAKAVEIHSISHPESQINAMQLSPCGTFLAAAGYQRIRLYNIAHSAQPIDLEASSKNVTAVGFDRNTNTMFAGGEDNTARIWDLRDKPLTCQRIFQVNTPVNTVCLHPNQVELFVGDASGTLYSWDLRNNANEMTPLEATGAPISIQHLAVDPDGTKLSAVTNTGTAYMWDLVGSHVIGALTLVNDPTIVPPAEVRSTKFKPKKKFTVHDKYALKCAFSPDNTLLATTSADQTAKLWTTADLSLMTTCKKTADMKDPMKWVWDCAFTNDSQHLFTCSSDGFVRLWRLDAGQEAQVVRTYDGHKGVVSCLAFRDTPV